MITHVAMIYQGKLWTLPKPNRHHNIIKLYYKTTGLSLNEHKEGFLDDHGNFLDRTQALKHALNCGQIKEPKFQPDLLFSEDLW